MNCEEMDSQSNSETPNRDHICIAIGRELDACPTGLPLGCHIFRVAHSLRNANEEAYEPKFVAIGPYHHGNAKLQGMEVYKKWYLKRLLDRRSEPNADKYIIALENKEVEARKFYAEQESFSFDRVEFVKMLLLDGCFLIEMFREYEQWGREQTLDANSIFHSSAMLGCLRRDLLLLENQLPFFVLVELFEMSTLQNSEHLAVLARNFLNHSLPGPRINYYTEGNIAVSDIKHLLELVHDSFCSPFDEFRKKQDQNQANRDDVRELNCAVELEEAGIEFQRSESDAESSFFHIQFSKGVMKIPPLVVQDDTETLLRNLVAYEQYRRYEHPKYVSDYIYFLNRLINSTKDVELLRRRGIILNCLGSDAAICSILNKLGDGVMFSSDFSHYSPVFGGVNQHCGRRRNLWMAKLRRYHLSSPWAVISVLAASMLLLLTFTQTAYTILAYYNGGHSSVSN